MSPPAEIRGRSASPGIAEGPAFRLQEARVDRTPSGDAAAEVDELTAAIAAASEDLVGLMAGLDGDSADIVEFQIAMLEDDVLRAPALAAIEIGQTADQAWRAALDEQIAEYEASDEDYFRARAADLTDMRDRVLRQLSGTAASPIPAGAVVIADDLTPTRFLETDWSAGGGVALARGSVSSHVAILARARGVPMVVGLGQLDPAGHREAVIDGDQGRLILSPDSAMRQEIREAVAAAREREAREREYLHREARTRDGERVWVQLNIMDPAELDHLDPGTCDGIGLMRTEFLFGDGVALPDEEAQFRAYRRLLQWAGDKPVTIRTLDAGGDKPISGLTPEGEPNSFLGLRGVRLSLARPDVFRVQLRALARAAVFGRLKVMLPMVTVPDELGRAGELLDAVVAELQAEGMACASPPLGMMVEVPAAAVAPELFEAAAFFSIGSNDLTQYVTASARDNHDVDALCDPAHPAVLKLMHQVAEYGRRSGLEVSLCGDMAGEPRYVPLLVAAGLRTLSVSSTALARTKASLAETALADPPCQNANPAPTSCPDPTPG